MIPTYWGIFNESMFRSINKLIIDQINPTSVWLSPIIFTLFFFLFFNNFLGMIPYSITPTVEIVLTLTLSFTMLMGVLLMGITSKNFHIFAMF